MASAVVWFTASSVDGDSHGVRNGIYSMPCSTVWSIVSWSVPSTDGSGYVYAWYISSFVFSVVFSVASSYVGTLYGVFSKDISMVRG